MIGGNPFRFLSYMFLSSVIYLLNSLATAGYGTALGVIRALYADGVLESAYCTETRPFNQVGIFFNFLEYIQFDIFITN